MSDNFGPLFEKQKNCKHTWGDIHSRYILWSGLVNLRYCTNCQQDLWEPVMDVDVVREIEKVIELIREHGFIDVEVRR